MKKLLLFTCFILSINSYAYNLIAECNGCNDAQSRQKAMQYANNIPNGGFVYVFNFSDHELKKYFAWKEDLSKANNNSKDIIKEKYKYLQSLGISEKQIINLYDNMDANSLTKSVITFLIEVVPSSQEIERFNGVDAVFNSFMQSALFRGNFRPDIINPTTGQPIGTGFGAYDLIGNTSLSTNLYNQSLDSWTTQIVNVMDFIEWATSSLDIINLDVTFKIVVTFPDGSKGIMTLNEYGELEFDDSSFIDSNGNRVPESASNVGGHTYNFNGGSNSSDNFNGFIDRLSLIGVSSGGTGSGASCTWECNGTGDCTITCKRN